jgi:hypothetical protein
MPEWRMRWGYEIATKASAPGIFKLRTGGYLVTARVRSRSGGRKTRTRALHEASLPEAKTVREDLRQSASAVARGTTRARMRWSNFAVSLLRRKMHDGRITSLATVERWEDTLTDHLIPAFGGFWCDELRYADLVNWRDTVVAPSFKLSEKVLNEDGREVRNPARYTPTTANGWLSILKVICGKMAAELELERDPSAELEYFDTSTHRTYTHEAPNALTPEWAGKFLDAMRERWPQHFAMTYLGIMTGLRPSSMRPLRRKGPSADVKWDEGYLLVRRSNARGQKVVERTKNKKDVRIDLPPDVLAVLKDHVAAIEDGPREESELLFPARQGQHLSRSVLDKPFADVCKVIGLPFKLTPRGMRRTNKDLMRAAAVPDVVSKAISGHLTDAMHAHYSTASSSEVREAIGAVADTIRAGKRAERSRGDAS